MEEEKFREILDRYIGGEASEEEQAWLESAYVNWNREQHHEPSESFLTKGIDQAWGSVSDYIHRDLKRDKIFRQSKTKRLLPLISAAALLVISLSGILIYNHKSSSSYLSNLPASADLKPGKNRAVLVLANGKKISLDQTVSGHIADENGISVSKTADGQIIYDIPEQDNSSGTKGYNTVFTPAGGQYQINLPDGTRVWLNAASSITFPTTVTDMRTVKLIGEAYFEVSKIMNQGKRIPFIVEGKNQTIEVLGTHFNVNAYENEPTVKTTLLEGSVKINNQTLLQPGQQARVQGESITVVAVNAEDFTDWQRGDFILENNDFRSIMRKISRWYDVDVVYAEDAPQKLKLGGWISRSRNISSILQVMEKTGKVHFKIEGRRITVTK